MIRKSHSLFPAHTCVTFELPAAMWADRIYVIVESPDGQQSRIPLVPGQDAVWQAEFDLPNGQQYAFHYLIDGEWRSDASADGFTSKGGGICTGIIDLRDIDPPPMAM